MLKLLVSLLLMTLLVSPSLAQRPDAPEYAQRGPYPVGTQSLLIGEDSERPLNATVWYPALNPDDVEESVVYARLPVMFAGRAITDAEPDLQAAPYPLVVFSHGNGGTRFQSIYLTEHLASHGFVVIAIDHPGNTLMDGITGGEEASFESLFTGYVDRPEDVRRTIDFAETWNTDLINPSRIVTMGHSFGGYTALAASGIGLDFTELTEWCATNAGTNDENVCFLLEERDLITTNDNLRQPVDPRIRATVALAPWNGPLLDSEALAERDVPTLIIVGGADAITPPSRDAETIYRTMFNTTPKGLVVLENGGHYLFVDDCSEQAVQFGFFDVCSDAVWDMPRAHDLVNHYTTGFLRSVLYEEDTLTTLQADDFPGVSTDFVTEGVTTLRPEVLAEYPHDTGAWTQGLLLHEGNFYESTGQYGESDLRRVDPETGEVLQIVRLNDQLFGEGLALVDERLYQLTWRENVAIVFDRETFEVLDTFQYDGEGWGLCHDGDVLYMTDGSSTLFVRDPQSFQIIDEIPVTLRGEPVERLNELECVGDTLYANVWLTDTIIQIDKDTGRVMAQINAEGLLTAEEAETADVLNGIAYDPEKDVFYITGKYWPTLFEVRFVPDA